MSCGIQPVGVGLYINACIIWCMVYGIWYMVYGVWYHITFALARRHAAIICMTRTETKQHMHGLQIKLASRYAVCTVILCLQAPGCLLLSTCLLSTRIEWLFASFQCIWTFALQYYTF